MRVKDSFVGRCIHGMEGARPSGQGFNVSRDCPYCAKRLELVELAKKRSAASA
jgi:hypothetical protein